MKKQLIPIIMIALVQATEGSSGLDTAALLDSDAAEVLEKKCIVTETGGVLPARFDKVACYLSQPNLVQHLQQEYRRSVSKNGTLDFPIVENGNGAYTYYNEKNQRTDLLELYRRQTSDATFDLVYHAEGKRFFGKYEVLVHIRAIDAGPAGTIYLALVHAYPHNGPMRFIARRFGTVERYFRRKTRMIAWVSTRICDGLEAPLPYAEQFPTLSSR